jgi:hypothetical protein
MSLRTCLIMLALAATPAVLVAGDAAANPTATTAADPFAKLSQEQMNEIAQAAAKLENGTATTLTVGGVSVTIAKTANGAIGLSSGGQAASMQVTSADGAVTGFSLNVGGKTRSFTVAKVTETFVKSGQSGFGHKVTRAIFNVVASSGNRNWIPYEITRFVITENKSTQTATSSGSVSSFNP